ncbi:hypothetical protein MCG98_08885 [Ruminococcus sp. OA3]|uniref:alpha/beta hydrolase family esterase n=1 Tax=Ruminococcus sp. OA3 TaxID=2914164 RepID=UPI001F050AA9|nr:PHB depolymerase family esterase [Ruminococcus sp. OA3]MCH1982676.1 hypothetical protein [Ruminococcus sp. OA3]
MENYSGYEFDPDFDRTDVDILCISGKSDIVQKPVDPADPYRSSHIGIFQRCIETGDNKETYAVYIPEDFPPFGDGIFVFAPGKISAEDYIQHSGIRKMADEHCMVLLILQSPDTLWKERSVENILAYARSAFLDMSLRDLYTWNEASYYVLGMEDGAYAANVFTMMYSSILAASVLRGDSSVSEEFLDIVKTLPSDGNRDIRKSDNPIPVWLIGEDERSVRYYRSACRTEEGYSVGNFARKYMPKPDPVLSLVDEQAVAEVWVSTPEETAGWESECFFDEAARFLLRFKRWAGTGKRKLRRTITADDIGLVKKEIIADGKKRYWYVYEPSAYRRDKTQKLPMVIGLHGLCGTGEFWAQNTEWHRVAEARDFIMVYPTAYMHIYGACMCATPAWSGSGMTLSDGHDDLPFFKAMIEKMCEEYVIDSERIYVAGHSNGSAMTQRLIEKMPAYFAAFGPNGYAEGDIAKECRLNSYEHSVVCPTWLFKGDRDIGSKADLTEGSANACVLGRLCEQNGADYRSPKIYQNGIYKNYVWYDKQRVPVVRFSALKGFPHAYTPENAWMTWDEYFCKFKRKRDGSVEYLG